MGQPRKSQNGSDRGSLLLEKETLVQLSALDLQGVAGGGDVSAASRPVVPDKAEETLSPHYHACLDC